MNIILTQQDADFILKFIRNDLEKLIISEKSHKEKYERLRQQYSKVEKDPVVDDLMGLALELHIGVEEGMSDFHKGLDRCVELLMCGSEVANENS